MADKNKRVTISEIASTIGVSKTTVSRYLNGQTDLMSKKTAERIKTVIELLDYHPSEFARALKSNKTKMIGLVIADIMSPWSSSIIAECSDTLSKNGYTALVYNCNDDVDSEIMAIDLLLRKGVDGLIVNNCRYTSKHLVEYSFRGNPIVLCDRHIKNYPLDVATFEAGKSMRGLVKHLKEQGFTRPVMFTQDWQENSARFRRVNAFKEAMQEEYGYAGKEDIYTIHVSDAADALLSLEKFMETVKPDEKPVVIGVNTMTTLRMFCCIQRLGISIPRQMGLCGPDDWDWDDAIRWSGLLYPEITTIKVNTKEIGRQCANLMLRRLENRDKEIEEIEVACELSVRASTLLK